MINKLKALKDNNIYLILLWLLDKIVLLILFLVFKN